MTSDSAFIFILGFLIIFASLTVAIALRYMRSAKKTTVVFLSHLAISNMVQGLNFFGHGVFYVWHVNTVDGCIISQAISTATTGTYMSGIFFVYLDLYLSLKKMSVSKPVISTRVAIALAAATWVIWLAWGLVGYGMRHMDFVYDHEAGCFIISGQFTSEYILFICVSFVGGFCGILMFHVLTYRLIKKAKEQQEEAQDAQQNRQPVTVTKAKPQDKSKETQKSKWLKKNDEILKMILIVLIVFVVCWYPLILATMLAAYCEPCLPYLPKQVIYMTYCLVVTQYLSNGLIYFIKIKEFQVGIKRLCCRFHPRYRNVEASNTNTENSVATNQKHEDLVITNM